MRTAGIIACIVVIGLVWAMMRRLPVPSARDAISVVEAPHPASPIRSLPEPAPPPSGQDAALRAGVEHDVRNALGDASLAILTAQQSGADRGGAVCGEMTGPSPSPVRYVWVPFARTLARDDGSTAFEELAREACSPIAS